MVEAGGDVTGEFQMLGLVSAYGYIVRLIEQDVARHQRRIGEEARIDVLRVLGALVLELGHAAKLAELGAAGQDPAHFCMGGHMALDENKALFRVDATGQQQGESLQALLLPELRIDMHREGVQVCDEIIALIVFLHLLPVLHRSQIIAQGENPCGLDAAEDDFFLFLCF